MTVHTHPWTAHRVNINCTEATEYLGGIYDVNNSGKSTLRFLDRTARLHCHAVTHASESPASKILVETKSTLAKVKYKAALST